MARRRIYVFDLAAILADAPPAPRRFRSSPAFAALNGVFLALAIVLARMLLQALPAHKLEIALAFLVAYLLVVGLFVALAMRLHYCRGR